MAKQAPALAERGDGRLYARVTRRCVAILKHIPQNRTFSLTHMAESIYKAELPDFYYLSQEGPKQLSPDRILTYLSFLVRLGGLTKTGATYTGNLPKQATDGQWVQSLADLGRELLADFMACPPADIPDRLERIRARLHRRLTVPRVSSVVIEAGIVPGTRTEEQFRWALYLYTDGPATELDIRHYPHLSRED